MGLHLIGSVKLTGRQTGFLTLKETARSGRGLLNNSPWFLKISPDLPASKPTIFRIFA
jgi:hypothetical protein